MSKTTVKINRINKALEDISGLDGEYGNIVKVQQWQE